MLRFLILLCLLQVNAAQSQRIFSATGILGSVLDMKNTTSSDKKIPSFAKGILRPSVSIGFETPQWKRFSLTTAASYFTSGGSSGEKIQTYYYPSHLLFDNFCLGLSGNYYIVNSKTQFYLGFGPRVDYARSQGAVYSEMMGDSYYKQPVRTVIVGITGSIGVNFQVGRVILGFKSNYYYRPNLLNKDFSMYPNHWGMTNHYKNITIRDYLFDLQFVLGYRFGKKEKS